MSGGKTGAETNWLNRRKKSARDKSAWKVHRCEYNLLQNFKKSDELKMSKKFGKSKKYPHMHT